MHFLSKFLFFAFMISTLSLSGCFKDQPSENDIKSMVAERFDYDFSGIFITSHVVKDNGYKKNETQYVAEVTISATAQQSLDDYAKSLMQSNELSAIEKMTATMTVGMLKLTMPDFAAGDRLEFKRYYLFIDTDNGWMLKQELKPNGEPLEDSL